MKSPFGDSMSTTMPQPDAVTMQGAVAASDVKTRPLAPHTSSLNKPLPHPPAASPISEMEPVRETAEGNEVAVEEDASDSLALLSPDSTDSLVSPTNLGSRATRPIAERRATAPEATSPSTPLSSRFTALTIEPRSRSPYSRSYHHSPSNSLLSPPAFPRSRSLPHADAGIPSSPLLRPASPFSSSGRRVSPLRRPFEDSYSFPRVDIDQTIGEDDELQLDNQPRPFLRIDSSGASSCSSMPSTPISPMPLSGHGTFPRTRRRPSSPLHVHLSSPGFSSRLHASASSPALRSPGPSPVDPAKYNESYPVPVITGSLVDKSNLNPPPAIANLANGVPYYATSVLSATSAGSMPSTPSSFRSRSPSISSLETIPDSPDAEAAATAAAEEDRNALARIRAAVLKSDDPATRRGRTMGRTSDGAGLGGSGGMGGSDKRKRWSVCGAERRGDLEMETIWED